MFLDEARIGALLNHPNIVHVYDVDEHDGIPYIAMEYIVGEELNELCRRGIAHDRFLPLEHAVELMRQAAAGHGLLPRASAAPRATCSRTSRSTSCTSTSRRRTCSSRRTASSRSSTSASRARSGQRQRSDVLPGKLGYMSPEQAARKPVDHRSDIFSLGIVLYEITVGKRLFRGTAQEVVARLVEAQIEPPTFVRRNFPTALEAIVMRALEKHPEDRYQSAYDLADDLEAFLRDERLHSGPVRIARYLDVLTHAAGGARRPELVSEAEARGDGPSELDFDSQVFDGSARARRAGSRAGAGVGGRRAARGRRRRGARHGARRAARAAHAGAGAARGDGAAHRQATARRRGRRGRRCDDPGRAGRRRSGRRADAVEAARAGRGRRARVSRRARGRARVSRRARGRARVARRAVVATAPAPAPASPPRRTPVLVPVPVPVPMPVPAAAPVPPAAPFVRGPAAAPPAPGFGQRLPWILVGALGVAVAALVAYIVMGV